MTTERPKQTRRSPEERIKQMLQAGYKIADQEGLAELNRVKLGAACGVTDGLVSRYFGNAQGMFNAVIGEAVKQKNLIVLADAVEMGMATEELVPPALLKKAKAEVRRRIREEAAAQEAQYA